MNTIDARKKGKRLNVTVQGDFNLHTKKMIVSRLNPAIDKLVINLINCERIDSEGIIFLHRWLQQGNKLQLIEPPAILFEILEILNLDSTWDFEKIIAN
ncbi:hypothetical protein SAMN05443144_10446 [Fodinibius roseus]|uniref:STAS domain-containing protein n=1 Tax=Fodinibius roseus TaxID=1194090 RepID=A0A1M4X7F5_9BACT|nr:hypothetical protein [Fodinibius roseus]SHE89424.1 hypothetical protein SAMN05443144_10446 [Fodinibius roseus]